LFGVDREIRTIVLLGVDRLIYTKGILQRLRGTPMAV
jgi:trehalose-6-phosphate synthase